MDIESSFSLPSPTNTPYRTPSSSRSRRLSDYEDMSPTITPPPMPSDQNLARRRSNDSNSSPPEGHISPLDPRRFTPTLHASLVSEILSLRRDLEGKTKHIDHLEQSLYTAQTQNESLNKSVLTSNKEVRSVRRQMQLLEGGTLSAINDLSKERDIAATDLAELRRRLEQSQKKVKSQEDSADRTQFLWDQDKESWSANKRILDTKIHVLEGRIKILLSEVTQLQSAGSTAEAINQTAKRSSRSISPTKRTPSEARDRRPSTTSVASGHANGRTSALSFTNGALTNLADEMALDDIDEVDTPTSTMDEGRVSPDALPEERGRPASSLSIKARKVLGLPFDIENMEHGERSHIHSEPMISVAKIVATRGRPANYADAGIQHSRPASPEVFTSSNVGSEVEDSEIYRERYSRPTMTSSMCQTTELILSPPPTPKPDLFLTTIHESMYEKPETKELGTQTELFAANWGSHHTSSRYIDESNNDGIPVIAIIPPGSRSVTPDHSVVLPPRTKNAGCQVSIQIPHTYISTSMQTEEIRIDRRNMISPDLLPSAILSGQVPTSNLKGKNTVYPRRGMSSTQPLSNSCLKRVTPPVPPLPPMNDSGPLSRSQSFEKSRPVRSSSLFAGFDDQIDENDNDLEDDVFEDNDSYNRPVPKFTLRSGRMVSEERSIEDDRLFTAASAGEALAMDILRQTEDSLPPELRQIDVSNGTKPLSRNSTIKRGGSSTRTNTIRRAAMISNGTAVHQSKLSQSTIDSSEGGSLPPPIPVPLRYSSARVSKSFSEGGRSSRGSSNPSPTRQGRNRIKPVLRKSRSGPAISPGALAARRQRSRSPPIDDNISIVPEMPSFEMPLPGGPAAAYELVNDPEEASAPRPAIATGPSRSYHTKSDSNAMALQQTSVVDAIAQTMMGEWMFKYVRRRKSFGKPDKDWDPNRSADELINNPGSAGVRHKRWVWVAPYERAVMWSNKQPMSNTALLGKSGRKLAIKSVLDVKDDNPMPKNSLTGIQFNRSILILTPQRALKFTATSQERHYIWLTALSFLSHSPLSFGDLAALPPPPVQEVNTFISPAESVTGSSLRRRKIRDSIRISKAPSRQIATGQSFATEVFTSVSDKGYFDNTRPPTRDFQEPSEAGAFAPIIKRYHSRARSNTAPKAPTGSLLSFLTRDSAPPLPTSQYMQTARSFDQGFTVPDPSNSRTGRRGSEASAFERPFGISSPVSTSFFDSNSSHNASMTMRMDAFVESKPASKGDFRNLRHGQNSSAAMSSKPIDRTKDFAFWGYDDHRSSISPVDILTPTESDLRYSGSTGHGSIGPEFFRAY